MIKYIGSKRRLVARLAAAADALGARTACDAFAGTTRVGQALQRAGLDVLSNDLASYSEHFGRTWIEATPERVDTARLQALASELAALPPRAGYVTEMFCEQARYFHPDNGQRIDAIRAGIDELDVDTTERSILLTALLLAADRVDSTTGVQMAYLKDWAPRAQRPLDLRLPELLPGSGRVSRMDATELARTAPKVDLWYLDPPYNQHSYFSNYHVWETIVRWDHPEAYGIARKRVDCRERPNAFNRKREAGAELAGLVDSIQSESIMVSCSNEGFHAADDIATMIAGKWELTTVAVPTRRYVGATIGIHNLRGERVGSVSHLNNVEFIFIGAPTRELADAAAAAAAHADDPAAAVLELTPAL